MVDREFQNLQRELRASLRQKSRLAEIGAATNKINHDLRNMLSTARLLSDRLAGSDDERTRALAPTIMSTIDRAARLASDAHRLCARPADAAARGFDLADLVDEVGIALQEQGEEREPNLRAQLGERVLTGECRVRADRDLLYRVFVNLGRNAFDAGASTVTRADRRPTAPTLLSTSPTTAPVVPQAWTVQLFQPFITGGRAGGAGLGLAIARDLVRATAATSRIDRYRRPRHDLPVHLAGMRALTKSSLGGPPRRCRRLWRRRVMSTSRVANDPSGRVRRGHLPFVESAKGRKPLLRSRAVRERHGCAAR